MTSPTRSGADRRIAVLSAALAAHVPTATPQPVRVPAAARAAHIAARRIGVAELAPLVAVVRNDEEAHRLADDLAAWLPVGMVRVLSERAALPLERALPEHDESGERLEVLGRPLRFSYWPMYRSRRFGLQAPLYASSPWALILDAEVSR